jgi:hypothetical protein
MTRQDIENEARRYVRDTNTDVTKQRWSSGTITSRQEDAQKDIVSKTRCLQQNTFITLAYDQQGYALPDDLYVINRVALTTTASSTTVLMSTGAFKKIDRFSILGLDSDSSFWEQQGVGQPTRYFIIGSSICLVPKPSVGYQGTNRLKLTYVPKPDDLSTSTSVPFKGYPSLYPYHILIAYYVAWHCYMDTGDFTSATFYQSLYYNSMAQMVKEIAISSSDDWSPNLSFRGITEEK